MTVFDGSKEYTLKPGDCGIGRRNYLAKYTKHPDNGAFNKIYLSFSQEFLKEFNAAYGHIPLHTKPDGAVVQLKKSVLIDNFIESITLNFGEYGRIEGQFLNIKRSELLHLLLKINPGLADIFFDFSDPEKIDLEKFMNTNFRFNVSIERFAYLTGRSLSGFKRDFEKIFNTTPSHWLIQRRLEEANYLITRKNKKPSEIYLELGFEDLSHFSFAFKKLFGHSPTQLIKGKV
ncbi:MAG TPA: AraC family transcriptional regulator [Cyclobacteriaceae bacterium]|nr:AraC family transcriptional regulator [Cyclobacteriaceae bacterium]